MAPRRIPLAPFRFLTGILVPAAVEPASNLQVLEVASKSMRVTWDPSVGQVSGYKVQMIPMLAGSRRQEVYVGGGQTSVVVGDLSPDVEYQINLYALKGLVPSQAVSVLQKTEPVKVSVGEEMPGPQDNLWRLREECVTAVCVFLMQSALWAWTFRPMWSCWSMAPTASVWLTLPR